MCCAASMFLYVFVRIKEEKKLLFLSSIWCVFGDCTHPQCPWPWTYETIKGFFPLSFSSVKSHPLQGGHCAACISEVF